MRVRLVPCRRDLGLPWWAVLVVSVWAAAVAWLWMLRPAGMPVCVLRRLTGVPCPTCGGTRAMAALGRGDVPYAVALNPLVVVGLGGLVMLLVMRVGLGRTFRAELGPRGRWLVGAAAFVVIAANWMYLVRDGR